MCSPRNIASRRSAHAALVGELREQPQRLVGDPVLRVVEEEAGALGDQPLAAAGVLGEQLAQVPLGRSRRGASRGPARPGASGAAVPGSLARSLTAGIGSA